jgi:hypothetical protein
MSSLADLPEVIGFFSYSREDDEASDGTLSALRDAIQQELSAQLGRSRTTFRLWQDQEAIAPGRLWESEIKAAVEQSVFFIPIVTPRAVNSDYCKSEFEAFLAREHTLGRTDLVFPLLYIRVPALESEAIWRKDPLLSIIGLRQYVDWRRFRHVDIRTTPVREANEVFCEKIVETLRKPWVSPEERRSQQDIDAQRRAEEEQRAAAKQRAEEERRRVAARPAEEDRQRAEAVRQAKEEKQKAEAARRAKEGRQRAKTLSDATLKAVQAYPEGARPSEVLSYLSREFGMTVRPDHLGITLQRHRRAERLETRDARWFVPGQQGGARSAEEERERGQAARLAEEEKQQAEAVQDANEIPEPDFRLEPHIVSELAKEFAGRSGVYIRPNIPPRKEANGRLTAKVPPDECVYILIDFTLFGSAKDCLIAGQSGLFYHFGSNSAPMPQNFALGYNDFKNAVISNIEKSPVLSTYLKINDVILNITGSGTPDDFLPHLQTLLR